MGLRDNRVWLVGRLILRRVRAERVGGVEIPLAIAVLRTYFPGGGSLDHEVLLVGQNAMEAAAFCAEVEEPEAAVDGWLLPTPSSRSLVVADSVSFVVSSAERKIVRERLRGPRIHVSPETLAALLASFRVDGTSER